jgi:hypothetical protein
MLHDPDFHPQQTLNYTVAALLGVLAGFIIGYVFGQAEPPFDSGKSTHPSSALEP